jgi:hypothetical protein
MGPPPQTIILMIATTSIFQHLFLSYDSLYIVPRYFKEFLSLSLSLDLNLARELCNSSCSLSLDVISYFKRICFNNATTMKIIFSSFTKKNETAQIENGMTV